MGSLPDMPFDTFDAEAKLRKIDLEKILTTFKKPWKKSSFDMKEFFIFQETFQGHHPNFEPIYNDGNYTLRLLHGSTPIASIGVIAEDDYIGIVQIQGTRYEDVGERYRGYLQPFESDLVRDVLHSFYWSHALLTTCANHFFDMGVKDLRVVAFDHNPNRDMRRGMLGVNSESRNAYVTYDLTALTLGFTPMLFKTMPSDMSTLSFDKEGRPDKNVLFYCMNREDYFGGVIDRLINRPIEENKTLLRHIHTQLGNYRQKELKFNVNMRMYEYSSVPALTEKSFQTSLF